MPKSLIFILILTLIIAPKALLFAQEASLEPGGSLLELSEAENSFKAPIWEESQNWPEKGKLWAQNWMEKAQIRLKEGLNQASESAERAAKAEIKRLANQKTQETKNALVGNIGKIKQAIEKKTGELISKIKNFLWEKFHFKTFAPKEKSAK